MRSLLQQWHVISHSSMRYGLVTCLAALQVPVIQNGGFANAWAARYEREDVITPFMTKAAATFPSLYKVSLPDTCTLPDPSLLPHLRELSIGAACYRLYYYLPTLTSLHVEDPTTLPMYLRATDNRPHALVHFSTQGELTSEFLRDLLDLVPSLKHLSVGSISLTYKLVDHPSCKLETLRVEGGALDSYTLAMLPYNVATDGDGRPRPMEIYGPTCEKCVTLDAHHLEVSSSYTHTRARPHIRMHVGGHVRALTLLPLTR